MEVKKKWVNILRQQKHTDTVARTQIIRMISDVPSIKRSRII